MGLAAWKHYAVLPAYAGHLTQTIGQQCWVDAGRIHHEADTHWHRSRVSDKHLEAINHRADAYVLDLSTVTGHLIDYTFVNSMKSTGRTVLRRAVKATLRRW